MKQKWMFFWNSLAFGMIQGMLAIWSLVPLPFLSPLYIFVYHIFFLHSSVVGRVLAIVNSAAMVSWVWNGDTVRNTERHLFSWILKSIPGSSVHGIFQARVGCHCLFRIYSLSYFQIHEIVLLTLYSSCSMLHPQDLLSLEVCTFWPPSLILPTPASGNHQLLLCIWVWLFLVDFLIQVSSRCISLSLTCFT